MPKERLRSLAIREPHRLFFPLAYAFLILGLAPWSLRGFAPSLSHPETFHVLMLGHGFLFSIASGVWLTGEARRQGAPPSGAGNVWALWIALLGLAAAGVVGVQTVRDRRKAPPKPAPAADLWEVRGQLLDVRDYEDLAVEEVLHELGVRCIVLQQQDAQLAPAGGLGRWLGGRLGQRVGHAHEVPAPAAGPRKVAVLMPGVR